VYQEAFGTSPGVPIHKTSNKKAQKEISRHECKANV
jgi:hypothetical protein